MIKKPLPFFLFFLAHLSCGPGEKNESVPDASSTSRDSAVSIPPQPAFHERPCFYDNGVSSLGIGLIITPRKFILYNDSLGTDPFLSLDIYGPEENLNGICPKFFSPDHGIMHFVCLESLEESYKVLTDSSTVKFLHKSPDLELKNWNDYILNSFGVRRLTDMRGGKAPGLYLKSQPDEMATSLDLPPGHEMFCAMEIKGDWVKVRFDCFYNLEDNPHEGQPCHEFIDQCNNALTGWLRWRNKNELLIDILLSP